MVDIDIQCGKRRWRIAGEQGSSILDQLLANAVPISYSCKRGDCGQCAASLIEGEVAPIEDGRPLWSGDAFLCCNAIARSDASIRLPYDPELEGIESMRSPAKIQALNRLSGDVMELVLRLPPANVMRFLPGQFVRLTNREGTIRSYSLAAGPSEDRLLRMHVRRVEQGAFSSWLFERAALNELLHVEGPQGRFFVRSDEAVEQTIFLATGTGIAPIWAMLSQAAERCRAQLGRVSLYWGNRFRSDAYMEERIRAGADQLGIQFIALYSRDSEDQAACSRRYVQEQMIADAPSLDRAQVYACGNPEMIEAARALARDAGLPDHRFHSDPFTAS